MGWNHFWCKISDFLNCVFMLLCFMKIDFKLYESQQNKHTIFKLRYLKHVYYSVLSFNCGALVVWITELVSWGEKKISWKQTHTSHCVPANCRTICCFTSPDFHFLNKAQFPKSYISLLIQKDFCWYTLNSKHTDLANWGPSGPA